MREPRFIAKQGRKPSGLLGQIVARVMAKETADESEQMPCRCILLRGPLTGLGAGSGAPAKVGLVEIIAKGIHKGIQS